MVNMKELVETLAQLETGMHFKQSDLRAALRKWPDLRLKIEKNREL